MVIKLVGRICHLTGNVAIESMGGKTFGLVEVDLIFGLPRKISSGAKRPSSLPTKDMQLTEFWINL